MVTALVRSFIAWSVLCKACIHVWVGATCAKRAAYWWHCKPVVAWLVTCNIGPAVYTIVRVICCRVLTRQFPIRFWRRVSSQSAIYTYAWLHCSWMLVLVFASTAETTSSIRISSSCYHRSTSCCDMSGWPRTCVRSIIMLCIFIIFDSLLPICRCWCKLIIASWSIYWCTSSWTCWPFCRCTWRATWLMSTSIIPIICWSIWRSCALSDISHTFC